MKNKELCERCLSSNAVVFIDNKGLKEQFCNICYGLITNQYGNEKQVILNKNDKPNSISFRYGGVGAEMKIYYNDDLDLKEQLEKLNNSSSDINASIQGIKLKLGG